MKPNYTQTTCNTYYRNTPLKAIQPESREGLMLDIESLGLQINLLEDAIIRMTEKLSPVLRMSGPAFESDLVEPCDVSSAEYIVKQHIKRLEDIRHGIDNIQYRASI